METRVLGQTGLAVSTLCMGCWEVGGLYWGPIAPEAALGLLRQAHAAGVTTFDLSDVYGNGRSEVLVGTALGAVRQQLILVTKAGYITGADGAQAVMKRPIAQRFDSAYLTWACEMSLWRLGTDYLDVFLLHDYLLASRDPAAAATEEPFEALRRLQAAGKIRHYGVSASVAVAQVAIERFGAEVVEVPFNLLDQRAAQHLFPLAAQRGVGILARSPFAQGRLFRTGDRTPGAVPDLHPFVRPPATSLAELAIKFVLSYAPVASVVTGVMREAELVENSAAAHPPFLPPDQVAELASAGSG